MAEHSRASMRAERSRETKQRIYDIAMDLFEEKGYDQVKVTDICDAADVSIGSFYHYYRSKEYILLACSSVLDEYFKKLAPTVLEKTASESLRKLIHCKLHFYTDLGVEICQKLAVASINFKEGSPLDIERSTYQYIERVIGDGIAKGEFRSDIDARQLTSILRYQLGGLVLRWCLEDSKFDLPLETDIMLSSFIQLLTLPRC